MESELAGEGALVGKPVLLGDGGDIEFGAEERITGRLNAGAHNEVTDRGAEDFLVEAIELSR